MIDIKATKQKLLSIDAEKAFLINKLSSYLDLKPQNIFYEYIKGNLPESGKTHEGVSFHFHGLGCSIKKTDTTPSVEIEFGPKGLYFAYDKYTLCYTLGVKNDSCETAVKLLIDGGVIQYADSDFYQTVAESDGNNWETPEEEIDAMVFDRLVLIQTLNQDT